MTHTKQDRLHLRVSEAHHDLIGQAAALEGLTLTGFATKHLVEAARQVVDTHQHTALSGQQARAFLDLLDAQQPPAGVERLRALQRRVRLPE